MKKYSENFGIGKSKYVVNFSDGIKTNKDGSEFYDIRIFSRKKDKDTFIKKLENYSYVKI